MQIANNSFDTLKFLSTSKLLLSLFTVQSARMKFCASMRHEFTIKYISIFSDYQNLKYKESNFPSEEKVYVGLLINNQTGEKKILFIEESKSR